MAAVAEPESADRVPRQHGKFETWFLFFNRALVIAMMTVMVTLVFTNVVTRYVFGFSVTWAEEFSQYLMVWIAFIAGGLALREGRHVAVEMLQDMLSPRSKRRLRILVAGLMAVFFATVAVLGVLFADADDEHLAGHSLRLRADRHDLPVRAPAVHLARLCRRRA